MYVYLTATFLVFQPQRGQTLEGWVNVQSEGFLGAVVLNLFSVGIERKRLPPSWKWIPPGEEDESGESQPATAPPSEDEDDENKPPFDPEKEHFNPVPLVQESNPFSLDIDQNQENTENQTQEQDQDQDLLEGYFQSTSGHKVRGTVKFRVVDVDVIPGTERDRGFLSIEGTMLSPEDEARVLEEERSGNVAPSSTLPIRRMTVPMASGGLVATDDVHLDTPTKKGKARA
ncbi:DNA-directed RNA polymerase I subunit RPA43 [Aspergillus stella-maris]|uniref:DNA-directed RNA polymerase I subunit RPA43 n=1 Tax=Aspergillus stella-maris TaxID=1810926 RepID=UPI003CCCE4B7